MAVRKRPQSAVNRGRGRVSKWIEESVLSELLNDLTDAELLSDPEAYATVDSFKRPFYTDGENRTMAPDDPLAVANTESYNELQAIRQAYANHFKSKMGIQVTTSIWPEVEDGADTGDYVLGFRPTKQQIEKIAATVTDTDPVDTGDDPDNPENES